MGLGPPVSYPLFLQLNPGFEWLVGSEGADVRSFALELTFSLSCTQVPRMANKYPTEQRSEILSKLSTYRFIIHRDSPLAPSYFM